MTFVQFPSSKAGPVAWRNHVMHIFTLFNERHGKMGEYDAFAAQLRVQEGIVQYVRGYGAVFESDEALTAFFLKWTY